ncbi:MAG TPA: hypothetical protein VNT42_10825, partial [Sphingomonas sp.]|nr:hypothetical protein [Sphingomonas sp.]
MFRTPCFAALVAGLLCSTAAYATDVKEEYLELEHMEYVPFVPSDLGGGSAISAGKHGKNVLLSFDGLSQYDTASVARNFIPP